MRKSCVLTLFVAIIWLNLISSGQGETRIEIDENGDEYELKRFHIQGRQLNGSGSKSQCVVTRRKRASRALAHPAVPGLTGYTVNSQQLNLAAPEHREAVVVDPESGKRRYVALAAVQLEEDDEEEDDDDDEEEEEEEEQQQQQGQQLNAQQEQLVQKLPQKQETQPKQLQGQTNLVAATFSLPANLPQGVSVVANAATHANVGGDAGIVVVESEQPPKVNPSTHAVFELKPLKSQAQQSQQTQQLDLHYWPQNYVLNQADEEDQDEDQDGDNEYFYYGGDHYEPVGFYDESEQFISEDSPISSTAIWSSDPEDVHPVINEPNQPTDADKRKKKRRKPSQEPARRKTQKQKQQEEQQLKRKQQKRKPSSSSSLSSSSSSSSTSSSAGSANSNKRRRPAQANPNKRQKQKKTKKPSQAVSSSSINANKRRRRPSSSSSSSSSISGSSSRPMGGYKRRRPAQSSGLQSLSQSQRRRQQKLKEQRRRQQEQLRRRRRRNRNRVNANGNGTGNRRRQYYDNEPIINCIYINKDPPTTTTTARPFWNLLGRDANGEKDTAATPPVEDSQMQRNGDFGNRKRTNLKFVA